MANIIFMFDGQGAFRPGVGKELCSKYPRAMEIIARANEILGYDLKEYLWGDKSSKTASCTSIAQPAISTISLAYAEVLKDYKFSPDVSLGHSLGEVSAIVYCEAVSFDDGIKLIKKRGELMEKGGKDGAMMAVVNIDMKLLQKLCKNVNDEGLGPVVIANINAPNQIVVSGSTQGIARLAQDVAQNRGRAIPLNVGGAWHSPKLEHSAREFGKFLEEEIAFKNPTRGFYSLVEQQVLQDGKAIKDALKKQMLSQVNWVKAIQNLKALGYKTFLEIGPSKILNDLVKKIDPEIKTDSTALSMDLETLARTLKEG